MRVVAVSLGLVTGRLLKVGPGVAAVPAHVSSYVMRFGYVCMHRKHTCASTNGQYMCKTEFTANNEGSSMVA